MIEKSRSPASTRISMGIEVSGSRVSIWEGELSPIDEIPGLGGSFRRGKVR